MGWEISIDILSTRGKIKSTIKGNINRVYTDEDLINVSLPVEGFADFQPFQFKQSDGKCIDTEQHYKISDKDIKYINDPKNWQPVKAAIKIKK